MDDKGPPLAAELVHEFVLKAHSDLDAVRSLLETEPKLVNASWDWGGGDWETGLGAASHIGRREIALFLLERGARLDVFAAAMLGELEIVRAILSEHPALRDAPGPPHGIPLVKHAEAGGEQAREVLEFLQRAPAAQPPVREADLGRGSGGTGRFPQGTTAASGAESRPL
jgi:hypothetical protein